MTGRAWERLRCAGVVLLLGAVAACSGGGGGNDVGGGGSSVGCADFSAAGTPGTADTVVAAKAAGSVCKRMALEVMVSGVNDVFAANFTVGYSPALTAFDGIDATGSFLSEGGLVPVLVQANDRGGLVVVGVSRQGVVSGVDAGGAQLLVTLFFRPTGNGSGALTFPTNELLDSGTPPVAKSGISWSGGTLIVR